MIPMYTYKWFIKQIISLLVLLLIISMGTACNKEVKEIDVESEKQKIFEKYYPTGNLEKINEKLSDLLEKVKALEGEHTADIIILYCNLGSCANLLERYEDAENHLLEAKKIIEEIGLVEPPVDEYFYTYGQIERQKGNNEQAVNYLQEALSIRQKFFGENSQEAGIICLPLAYSYMELEDYDNAEHYAQLVLMPTIYEGSNWLFVTNASIILGDIDFLREKYMDAYSDYVEARRNLERHFDTDTVQAAVILAEIYEKQADAQYQREGGESLALSYDVESYRYLLKIPKTLVSDEMVENKEKKLFSVWKQVYKDDDKKVFSEWLKKELKKSETENGVW